MTWEIGSRMIRLFLSPKRYHLSSPFTPTAASATVRSEEHTSELQSPCNLVCRLLLEKKKQTHTYMTSSKHVMMSNTGRLRCQEGIVAVAVWAVISDLTTLSALFPSLLCDSLRAAEHR